jgi:hypothetical protein
MPSATAATTSAEPSIRSSGRVGKIVGDRVDLAG